MYTLFLVLSVLVILTSLTLFALRKEISSLISWLQVFFCISFFSFIALMQYYIHYYLGESQLLQRIYLGLFYLSVILLLLIIGLKIVRYYKSNNKLL